MEGKNWVNQKKKTEQEKARKAEKRNKENHRGSWGRRQAPGGKVKGTGCSRGGQKGARNL